MVVVVVAVCVCVCTSFAWSFKSNVTVTAAYDTSTEKNDLSLGLFEEYILIEKIFVYLLNPGQLLRKK